MPLRLLGSFFHIAMNGNAAADKIFRLIDLEEDVTEKSESIGGESEEVTFVNVSFSYDSEKEVLSGINLRAGHGLTALVGESGCGKSTMTLLLLGDRTSDTGQILLGNTLIEELDAKVLRRKITRIRHDSYLFAGTVRENLLMGKGDATENQMREALREVNLLDFVEESGGLDFVLLEKASNLSGGQNEETALARALLHDTPIYIFDEATSNVDVESENDIMKVVRKLSNIKTVILISHRLANVVSADQIYVLKNGRIA